MARRTFAGSVVYIVNENELKNVPQRQKTYGADKPLIKELSFLAIGNRFAQQTNFLNIK